MSYFIEVLISSILIIIMIENYVITFDRLMQLATINYNAWSCEYRLRLKGTVESADLNLLESGRFLASRYHVPRAEIEERLLTLRGELQNYVEKAYGETATRSCSINEENVAVEPYEQENRETTQPNWYFRFRVKP